ncbi:hypothetical protein, partial [Escherichia coli]|uniref:hypothetical protein n=1 Tax=Escherichia coli TaxID=562 RepID=UPI001BAFA6EF
LFSDCGKRQVFIPPQSFNHISRVLDVTVLLPENTSCATHAATIHTPFIPKSNDKTQNCD